MVESTFEQDGQVPEHTTVLLIDDSQSDATMIEALLRSAPSSTFDVRWVSDAKQGEEALASNNYDICLLDYRLNGHDGLEVLQGALSLGCKKPVVLLTGFPDIALDVRAMEYGAVEFLEKDKLDYISLERTIRYTIGSWRSRERLQASLREKEVLLRELHHRVKNNLQVIASMLRLQSGVAKNEETRQALQESCERIYSIALVHEQLYREESLERVKLGNYIRELVQRLCTAYEAPTARIKTEIEVSECNLPLAMAIPCGLVIHELVSNALKHAFPDNRSGLITVSVHEEADGNYNLTVKDDGVGMASTENNKTLGLGLMRAVVNQLKGKAELKQTSGTTWTIKFPLECKDERRSVS